MRCTTTGCVRQQECPGMGKCKQCYAYFSRWYKINSSRRLVARRAQIKLWENRLEEMLIERNAKRKAG